MKLVSVLLPVFNGASFLNEAIDSILSQTFSDFELLIINDASTDESEEIILSYYDDRIRYYKNEINSGLVFTLNRGLELSNGKYIARMDQDDISKVDRLQMQYEFLEANPDHCVIGSQIQIINTNNLITYPLQNESVKLNLLWRPAFAHPAVMIRRSILILNKINYDSNFAHAEDYAFWVKLSQYGKMANLNEVLLKYRFHEHQYTSKYKFAMKSAGRNARIWYYDIIPAQWNKSEKGLFIEIVDAAINYADHLACTKAGKLLLNLNWVFKFCGFNESELMNSAANYWKEICVNRQKLGYPSTKLFFSNPLYAKCSWRIQAWFLKQGLKKMFKVFDRTSQV